MIFGFSSSRERGPDDPLRSARSVAAFLGHGIPLDATARSEQLIDALALLRSAEVAIDPDRAEALIAVDAALANDHWTLLKRHGETLGAAPARSARLRQLIAERNQGFVAAYQRAVAAALAHATERRWKPLLPGLLAGSVRAHGHELDVLVLAGEGPAPSTWSTLHALYLRAAQLGVERVPALPGGTPSAGSPLLVEHEYVHALLVDRLRTGNLAPGELAWAIRQMHPWSRALALLGQPADAQGFCVNFDGAEGLRRRTGLAAGTRIGYLDTGPVVAELDQTVAELSLPTAGDQPAERLLRQQRIAILERVRPALTSRRSADLRQQLRIPANLAADVCIGLARIAQRLLANLTPVAAATAARPAAPLAAAPESPASRQPRPAGSAAPVTPPLPWADCEIEEIVIPAVKHADWTDAPGGPSPGAPARPEPAEETPVASPSPAPRWNIDDRSVSGLRVSAPAGAVDPPRLGALVAVLPEDGGSWLLAAVRRTDRGADGRLILGLGLLSRRVTPIKLRGHRVASADLGFTVDGVDVAALGPGFDGLFLPLSGEPEQDLGASSLILPAVEYRPDRQLLATTAHADHSITLGEVADQRAGWCRVQVASAAKLPRE